MEQTAEDKHDNPRVYFPPPAIYILTFVAAVLMQKIIPLNVFPFHAFCTRIFGVAFAAKGFYFLGRSIRQFFVSKNTLVTVLPAKSLQTTGIYGFTRNPMYFGLMGVYLAVACFIGNWWNIVLFPLPFILVQEYIVKREENYLMRRFGQSYLDYKAKVRRWL